MAKRGKAPRPTGDDPGRHEAAKAAYASNIHVKRAWFLLDAAELMGVAYPNVSRGYIRELREIAQKHVIRLHPSFKRVFCRGCNTLLLPGKNAVVRAECHGEGRRRVPGSAGELEYTCASPSAAPSAGLRGGESQNGPVLDEGAYNWLSVTCCVCTRTRRTRLQHPESLHLQNSAEEEAN
ncbi:Rpr2-domain-containing protein [Babesia caballi]|uniref:Rpr2-domain-containing protein n=1 Tax=Babesia caballi TaxID=5871 RepID=A0AAV4LT95_BABCB|nr:Rpr2-domain-containing protein [Babesia caballi]